MKSLLTYVGRIGDFFAFTYRFFRQSFLTLLLLLDAIFMVRWLHISDLHLGDDDMSSTLLREELPLFLESQNFKFDYVFVTGDIRTANASPNCFTDDMADYLKRLCQSVGITTERLFIVPGNHDVDRDAAGRDEAVRKVMFGRTGYYVPARGKMEEEDTERILCGEKDFYEFLAGLYDEDRRALYGKPSSPHFNIETEDFNILHVDSTLVYTKGQEANDLVVGTKYLQNALASLNKDKPTLLLSHYPVTSMLQDEKKYLSTLLQKHGVKLWMAGHEHDHILQKIHYLYSLQAGELRYEENSHATFLTGDYDPLTCRCRVSAYTWFAEGWAKYPIVDLEGREQDVFEFSLEPQNKKAPSSITGHTQELNQPFYSVLPDEIEKDLFPEIEADEEVFQLDTLLSDSWNSGTPHVILLADGGMGKSTMLMDFCKNSTIPVLYLPAERLVALDMGIEKYCVNFLFRGNADGYRNALLNKYREPSLCLVVDGINEVDGHSERKFINELQRISMFKGVQIIVSSRSDFTIRYSMVGFRRSRLRLLEDRNIQRFFSQREWEHIKDTATLKNLLRNPMMVTIYREVCSVIETYNNVEFLDWILPVQNASDLFHNYYLAQIALMMRRGNVDSRKILLAMVCIQEVLPAIAYSYEQAYLLHKSNDEFRKLLDDVLEHGTVQEDTLDAVREYFRNFDLMELHRGTVADLLVNELHLLYRDKRTTFFPHQMYRDYLSAQWIVKESYGADKIEQVWNKREIPFPVMEHVRMCSGRYWEGIAEQVHQAGRSRADAGCMIRNLFACFPSDDRGGCADYSGLDLTGVQLPDNVVSASKILLKDCCIDKDTLGFFSGNPLRFTTLCFSPDCSFLAASADKNVVIYSIKDGRKPFRYDIGKKTAKMAFYSRFPIVNAGSLIVFVHEDEWRYVGEIKDKDGSVTRKLRSLYAKNDVLYLYYTNREVRYRLSDCSRLEIINGKDRGANHADGENLSLLKQTFFPYSVGEQPDEIIAKAEELELHAVSYGDGRLEVYHGKELVTQLERGVTILMDAAISGDGTVAATLSYAVFDGRRRIQIWDLNRQSKMTDVYCPKSVKRIHLAECGVWLLGETPGATWTYNYENHIERWYKEHFVSNHQGRLVTYKDNVLRKDARHNLFLFNLDSGEMRAQDCPVSNPKLVCFFNDGSLAAVNASGRLLKFKSRRNGEVMTVNKDGAEIVSIQPFKQQPFIAVATSDGLISIYHTGDGLRKRKLDSHMPANKVIIHPTLTVIAHSDGRRYLETRNYYEWDGHGKRCGRWYDNPYGGKPFIDSNILDMAFNEARHLLVVIQANGRIQFHHEKYCDYKSSFTIITAFHVDAYEFEGIQCSPELQEELKRNGA